MTSPWIMNARMYAVAPEVEAAWRGLLERVADEAGVVGRVAVAEVVPG